MAASDPSLGSYFEKALEHYRKASFEFDAVGNHRLSAIVQNNQGFLLLTLGRTEGVHQLLIRARRSFEKLGDNVRTAQVDETFARFHLSQGNLQYAEEAIERSIRTLEQGDEDALLAESLTTKGLILFESNRIAQARAVLEVAHKVAERCGDREGAGRALLLILEKMRDVMSPIEQIEMCHRAHLLLDETQQVSVRFRLAKCLRDFGIG
jgi:tetratricopeptide (TPR) repeat protein